MNINGMFAGTNEEFEAFLNELLKIIEEDECDCNDCCGCTDECVDMCWDEAIREILKQEEEGEAERAKPVEIAIKDVIYSGPATIIKWNDGTKTMVKCEPDEEYNKEKGFVMAYMKKLLGDKKFFKELKKWVWKNPRANFDQKNKERQKAQGKKIKIETHVDFPEENIIQKIADEMEKLTEERSEPNKAVITEPIGDVTKITEITCESDNAASVTCTCGVEYEIAAGADFASCPECGVVTKVDNSVQ